MVRRVLYRMWRHPPPSRMLSGTYVYDLDRPCAPWSQLSGRRAAVTRVLVPAYNEWSGQRPNSSTVWSTEVKPASAATFVAHCSTTRPSTSTLRPHSRHVRWW
jgi:hypothetical protein